MCVHLRLDCLLIEPIAEPDNILLCVTSNPAISLVNINGRASTPNSVFHQILLVSQAPQLPRSQALEPFYSSQNPLNSNLTLKQLLGKGSFEKFFFYNFLNRGGGGRSGQTFLIFQTFLFSFFHVLIHTNLQKNFFFTGGVPPSDHQNF